MTKKKNTGKIDQKNIKEVVKIKPEDLDGGLVDKLDENRIKAAEKDLEKAKEKLTDKVYTVQFENKKSMERFINFIELKAEWNNREGLGIMQISKSYHEAIKEVSKDFIIYLTSLEVEASHYFISKIKGVGLNEAKDFVTILKPFEIAKKSIDQDAQDVNRLEVELNAAKQGLKTA